MSFKSQEVEVESSQS